MIPTKSSLKQEPFEDSHSMEFDGTGDSFSGGFGLDDIWDNTGAVSGWIYPRTDGEDSKGTIISKVQAGSGRWRIYVNGEGSSTTDGGVTGRIGTRLWFGRDRSTDGIWNTSYHLPLKQWSHFLILYNDNSTANNPFIYINGKEMSLTESSTPSGIGTSDANSELFIGEYEGCESFDGNIADLAVYTTFSKNNLAEYRKYAREIYNDRRPFNHKDWRESDKLVAWWRMGDGKNYKEHFTTHNVSTGRTGMCVFDEVKGRVENGSSLIEDPGCTATLSPGDSAENGWNIKDGNTHDHSSMGSGVMNIKTAAGFDFSGFYTANIMTTGYIYELQFTIKRRAVSHGGSSTAGHISMSLLHRAEDKGTQYESWQRSTNAPSATWSSADDYYYVTHWFAASQYQAGVLCLEEYASAGGDFDLDDINLYRIDNNTVYPLTESSLNSGKPVRRNLTPW